MEYEVAKDRNDPDTWRVEATGEDGEVYVAVFSGPDAEPLAREYADFKSRVPSLAGTR